MIVLDVLSDALRLAGIGSPGETPSSEDTQIALDSFNGLLEDWSLQNLAVYTLVDAIYALVNGQGGYTIGAAGNFNGVRPIQIESLFVVYNSISYPVKQITNDDFNAIPYKAQTGPIPFVYQYDPAFPLGTVNFWPIPNQALPVTLTANQQLAAAALASTVLSLPPGYSRALRYNLAVDLCAEYGRDCPPDVQKIATRSMANVKRANMVPQEISVDAALMGLDGPGSPGGYYANFIAGNF